MPSTFEITILRRRSPSALSSHRSRRAARRSWFRIDGQRTRSTKAPVARLTKIAVAASAAWTQIGTVIWMA